MIFQPLVFTVLIIRWVQVKQVVSIFRGSEIEIAVVEDTCLPRE